MAAGFLLGLFLPPVAALLRPFLTVLVLALMTVVYLRIDPQRLAAQVRAPGTLAMAVLWIMVLSPLVAAGVLALVDLPPTLKAAVILWAASPPLASAATVAMILGLDGALAFVLSLIASFLLPLTLPPLAVVVLGLELGLQPWTLSLRLAVMIIGTALAALVLRRLIGAAAIKRHPLRIDGLAVVFLFLFGIAVMDGAAETIFKNPAVAGLLVVTAFASTGLMIAFGTAIFWWSSRVTAGAIGFVSGNRNFALVLASGGAWPADYFLYFAAIQFPIYLLPLILRPYARWLTDGDKDTS